MAQAPHLPKGRIRANGGRQASMAHTISDDPIAVIGYSLRFPQEATSTDAFWGMLCEQRCAMTDWPEDRLNASAFRHPDNSRLDQQPVKGAHFMTGDPGAFDATFFGIPPLEAIAMDPQQRGLLETTYRALENAGLPMECVFGTKTSVYTGCFSEDYKMVMMKDLENLPKYAATGGAMTILANRLSWFFGLTGASMNIDTACSSSLTALDMACKGLLDGSTDMGIVAGTNSIFGLEFFLTLGNMGFLSPDGRCFSFDSRANGYARGEGHGVVILKRVSDAIKAGDTIRAVIRSTGCNQDGHTAGITNPSQEAQTKLIRETYAQAGLEMGLTRYFEAHGTGTLVGDVIESNAIGGGFRKYRSADDPLYIGAVKSNIGHLEGASGVAGLIKTIIVLERGLIPANANFVKLNPAIDAEFLNLKFPQELTPWPHDGLRRASLNSFGFGGSNAHAVLDDAYNYLKQRRLIANHCTAEVPPLKDELRNLFSAIRPTVQINDVDQDNDTQMTNGVDTEPMLTAPARVFPISAADEAGITRIVEAYTEHFKNQCMSKREERDYLANLSYTLAARRSSLVWKATAVASTLEDLRNLKTLISRPSRQTQKLGVAYVFTGQGAQVYQMGLDLLPLEVFKITLLNASRCLEDIGCEWSLMDELLKDSATSNVNNPAYSQPLCTALQIALIELLQSFGVRPAAVVGHSSGEIAAAYALGALSLESAMKVAYFRGILAASLISSSRTQGAMMSVGLSEDQASEYIARIQSRNYNGMHVGNLVVGCINSPKNVTVSGPEVKVDTLKEILDAEGIFARKLVVEVAYHSPQMEIIAAAYRACMGKLKKGTTVLGDPKMASSVTGEMITADELSSPDYWVKNMVSPVRFVSAVSRLVSQSPKALTKKLNRSHRSAFVVYDLIELGPHAALRGPIRDILSTLERGSEVNYDSVLVRKTSGIETTLNSVARLYRLGYSISLAAINHQDRAASEVRLQSLTNLPEYQFDHSQSYWSESHLSTKFRLREHPRLDLLGTPSVEWNTAEAKWRKITRIAETPWVQDHKINGAIIYPAAGMLVMAIEGIRQLAEKGRPVQGYKLTEVTFNAPLTISAETETETELRIRSLRDASEKGSGWSEFRVYLLKDAQWIETCRGIVSIEYEEKTRTEVDGGRERALRKKNLQQIYESAVATCQRRVSKQDMYSYLRDTGLNYGPYFQAMDNMASNDFGEATADIHVFKASKEETANSTPVIHPVTLDAVAQLMFVSLSRGMQDTMPTTIPTRITDCWVSNEMTREPLIDVLEARTKSVHKGYRNTESSIFALDKRSGEPMLSIAKLESTTVSSESTREDKIKTRQRCYHLSWKPDIAMMSTEQIQITCSEGRMAGLCPEVLRPQLNLLLSILIADANSSISQSGSRIIIPAMKKYLEWMRTQTLPFGDIKVDEQNALEMKALAQDPEHQKRLLVQFAQQDGEAQWLVAVASQLPYILQGSIDVTSVASPRPATDKSPLQFSWSQSSAFLNFLQLLAHKNPGLKVLEIGDPTEGPDHQLIDHFRLSDENAEEEVGISEYCFVHQSDEVIDTVRSQYPEDSSRLAFKPFDIKEDVKVQGFEAGSYDLVIVNASLHYSTEIDDIMQRLHQILRPGGKLVVRNTAHDAFAAEFALQLLPECDGWWSSVEQTQSHYLPFVQWEDTIARSRLWEGTFALHDCVDIKSQFLGCLVSNASSVPAKDSTTKIGVVAADNVQYQDKPLQGVVASLPDLFPVLLSLDEDVKSESYPPAFYIFMVETEKPLLPSLHETLFKRLKSIMCSASGILWVTNGGGQTPVDPGYHMIDGLARTLRTENPTIPFVTLALQKDSSDESRTNKISQVLMSTLSSSIDSYETEFCEVNGILQTNRVIEASEIKKMVHTKTMPQVSRVQTIAESPPLTLSIGAVGLLDTLQFIQDPIYELPLEAHEVEIDVKATGLNFMDCLVALGRIAENTLGSECAGVVTRAGANTTFKPGDCVCAVVLDCFKTFARADARAVACIPDTMSFSEAAAIPIQFITAYYALDKLAHLTEGESVLIHSASGGTGQAAIQVAQYLGAEIFVTVGSDKKKDLIMKEYNIPEDHILYSRNLSFADGIKRMTKNGVDVVLNSLAGEGLVASWESIAPFGRFVEIGKFDIHTHKSLPMFQFANNVSFHAFDLVSMRKHKPNLIQKSLKAVLAMFEEKRLRTAQPLNTYPISKVEDAFRYMQSGVNVGKTVVEMVKEDKVLTVLENRPTWSFESDATYVIAGGFGGQGRSIARWIVSRGAKHILLLSRSGAKSQSSIELLEELVGQGVQVHASPCDVTSADSLASLLEDCRKAMPPIKGCFQSTMVLRDGIFERMSYDDWNTSTEAKVRGSWNLHTMLPDDMDFFIFLSSIAGVLGTGGQGNYAAGNSYMDALAQHRISRGQKAVSLDLGWMESEGVVAENDFLRKGFEAASFLAPVSQAELFALLDHYCDPTLELATKQSCQMVIGVETPAAIRENGAEIPYFMQRSNFRALYHIGGGPSAGASSDQGESFSELINKVDSLTEAGAIVRKTLVAKLGRALSVDPEDLDASKPLHAYGVDSLLAVELRNWFAKEWSADVAIFDIMGAPSLTAVSLTVAGKSGFRKAAWK